MEAPSDLVARLAAPRSSQFVYREECTQCFDDQDSPLGVDVCMTCFNGSCPHGSTNGHSPLHYQKTGHAITLNVKRKRKPVIRNERDGNEPPVKKLAIREEPTEHEKYDFELTPKIYVDGQPVVLASNEKIASVVAAIMSSMSSAQKSEVKAWEEEIVSCKHTTELVQPAPKQLEAAGLASCAHEGCGLTSNLWLCLICGSLGCGRQQFGGGGGNGHGLAHVNSTGHSVAVKLGTIEPDGTADIYCYACDDSRLDPHLPKHLANFGIEVAGQRKTEKSMTELQVEQNLTFDFAMTGADGKELEPLTGPGLTGLKNLGNSCYMASTLQSLFSFPTFQARYLTGFLTHTINCSKTLPADCFECQMSKIADGLLSGRYSVPRDTVRDDSPGYASPIQEKVPQQNDKPSVVFQEGIRPIMFKSLVGKDHAEFSTMRQQDAGEFLAYLLEVIRRSSKSSGEDNPTSIFGFALEERLQCSDCRGVRYKQANEELLPLPVPVVKKKQTSEAMDVEGATKDEEEFEEVKLETCLDNLTSPIAIEYDCPACAKKVTAIKTTRFSTFPDVLLINAARFQLDNWVPRKVDVPLLVPHDDLVLDKYVGRGKQENEVELPQSEESEAAAEPTYDAEAMAQLSGMGFPENRCKRALIATGHHGAEVAMNWLFEHMEDPDIDEEIVPQAQTTAAAEPSEEQISTIVDMGFTPAQGRKALRETGGDASRAVEWLFSHPDDQGEEAGSGTGPATTPSGPGGLAELPSKYRLKAFMSHKGPSVHSGHYVAHVRTEEHGWVLFNDEKVVKAEAGAQSASALSTQAYVYFLERIKN